MVTDQPAEIEPGPMRTTDADLLRKLYERYAEDLYRIAYRLTGSSADAEDVVQEVFVGLPEAMIGYEERGQIGPWIRRVGTRVALLKLRNRSRRKEVPIEAGPEPEAGRTMEAAIDAIDVQRALDSLPATLRSVVVLKELEGYSHEDIGEVLGIRPGASKVRLYRAREMLRNWFRRRS
jgi:RNA polymerase sigma-70 factor, ECF subfamily